MAETPSPANRRRSPWVMPVAVAAACVLLWLIFGQGTSSKYAPPSSSGSSKAPPLTPMGEPPPSPWPIDSQGENANEPKPPWDQITPTKPPAPPPIELPPDTQLLTEEFV